MSGGKQGAASAGRPETVASEAARSPQANTDTTAPPPDGTPDTSTCADCGSSEVVYVTEDPAAEPKGYCETHLPANVTEKMVKEQRGE